MRIETLALAAIAVALWSHSAGARPSPLGNPVMMNIGFICAWEMQCMTRQERSMRRALAFVQKRRPPAWKVQLCNRNASRRAQRVDWIGFHNCIQNARLQPAKNRRRG